MQSSKKEEPDADEELDVLGDKRSGGKEEAAPHTAREEGWEEEDPSCS